jgi:signal transduction histidine kinase
LELRGQNQTIQLVADTVAHDVLTPLKCVKQMLQKVRSVDTGILQTISHTCDMVLGQVKASLDFNLAGLNMFQAKLEECRLVSEVLKPVIAIFQVQAEELGLRLLCAAVESVNQDPLVLIDKLRVQQIVVNLIQNSIKYSFKDGQIKVIVQQEFRRMSYSSEEESDSSQADYSLPEFTFSIIDQGKGIEDPDNLFKPVRQNQTFESRASSDLGHESNGLGLSISKRIA